jgi:hypothetical protein
MSPRLARLTLVLVAVLALGSALIAAEAPAQAPATGTAPAAAPGDAPSQAPPATGGRTEDGADLPALDLEPPAAAPMCKANWCSSDSQCETWYGPGCVCDLAPGASCGHCAC